MVIAMGDLNVAAVPMLSLEPELPDPAMVVTAPVDITIFRIR